jgi:hypothetical protein
MNEDAKPVVVASLEDDTGDRCVDIIRHGDGQYTFHECRRDPEDNHGWRRLSEAEGERYASEFAAYQAALKAAPWLLD